jgi:UPF0755 protein
MKKGILLLLALLATGALGAAGFWYVTERRITLFSAKAFGTAEPKRVEIPAGTNPHGVANLLAQAQIVSNGDLAYAWLRREKLGPRLKAGEYEFSGPLTPKQVLERIVAGQVKQYRFTIAEGLRVDEILPLLSASELHLNAEKLKTLATEGAFIRKLGVPADSLEGFLCPETYSFPRGASEEAVLSRMVARTLDQVKSCPRKPGIDLDLLQTVTLASIVEKETASAEERPRISCVFHNRLRLRMKLQTDPTVLYAMMLLNGTYSKNITSKDLEADHPYNTYTNRGLPPGPIASPGALAIAAALNPIACNDLFFVSRNDGTHVFCPDLKCHNENVRRWQKGP